MNFIIAIEELSKSINLHKGEIEGFTREVLEKSSDVLNCQRCNAWLFNKESQQLDSISSFCSKQKSFGKEQPLKRSELPGYFSYLKRNKLIVSANAQEEPMNKELLADYLIPNGIESMIDVPIRSEGKMVGVICFEKVNNRHDWFEDEQKYAQSVGQLLSLALETKEKKAYRNELEKIIIQKEVLIAEINHRVKNNLAVIVSLLKLQKEKAKDVFHNGLFNEIKDKVYSIAAVQQQLHASDNVESIDLSEYILDLSENIRTSYGKEKVIEIDLMLENVQMDVSRVIPCGLILNEILTNSYKHAFKPSNLFPKLIVSLSRRENLISLFVKDNGNGYNGIEIENGMGLDLMRGLAEQINAELKIDTVNGVETTLTFSV